MHDTELLAIKQDMSLMCRTVGIDRPSSHATCIFCGKKSLSISRDKSNHCIIFKCHSCGEGGDILQLVMKINGVGYGDAILSLKGKTRITPKKVFIPADKNKPEQVRPVPVLDMDRAEKLVQYANERLMANMDYVKKFERGLSAKIVEDYRIGILLDEHYPIYGRGKPYFFNASWVLPITNEDGELNGVKLHHQIPPITGKGEEFKGKCSWAPFGTEPKEDFEQGIHPNHSFYTLWPHPYHLGDFDTEFTVDPNWWINQLESGSDMYERWHGALQSEFGSIAYALGIHVGELNPTQLSQAFNNAYGNMGKEIRQYVQSRKKKVVVRESDDIDLSDYIFICPGELKALALMSEGYRATAVTGGESWIPARDLLDSLRGQKVCLFWDNDQPSKMKNSNQWRCAGKTWASKMAYALKAARVKEIIAMNGGQIDLGEREDTDEKEEELKI